MTISWWTKQHSQNIKWINQEQNHLMKRIIAALLECKAITKWCNTHLILAQLYQLFSEAFFLLHLPHLLCCLCKGFMMSQKVYFVM